MEIPGLNACLICERQYASHPNFSLAATALLHHAFVVLAVLTLVSSAAFWTLRPQDDESVIKGSAALA